MSARARVEDLERRLLEAGIVRLRARVMALVAAAVGGAGLFVATAWLLVRGGEDVGEHLSLLDNFFPGYTVTWPGALVGAAYGALVGAILGWSAAWIYNRVAGRSLDA